MATEIKLPQWGEMASAIVTNWLKKEGDQINKGEPLLELETEKINSDLESPISGYWHLGSYPSANCPWRTPLPGSLPHTWRFGRRAPLTERHWLKPSKRQMVL